jgi:hypothetical protein
LGDPIGPDDREGTEIEALFTVSPPAMIQRDRTEQIDGMINLARDQQGGIDIAGIDHVRQQSTPGESALNRCRHRPVRRSRRSGLDIRDQVRPIRLSVK